MPKQKKGLTHEEKLAKDRIRKKNKYAEIKNNPELYAIQKEKERKRYILRKNKKKIRSITEMTPREQREQRKRWRRNARNYLKKKEEQRKLEKILIDNSPPESESDANHLNGNVPEQDPLERTSEKDGSISSKAGVICQPIQVSGVIRKMRYRHQKVVKTLQEQIEKLKKEKKTLQRKILFEVKQKKTSEDSIEKRVNNLITDVRPERVEEVKKNLLFSESLTRDMTTGYKTLKKKEKRVFADTVIKNKDRLKKYKVTKKIPFRLRKNIPKETPNIIKIKIQRFFEEDNHSRVAAGKNEYIKQKGITQQKRYTNDNLKNLYAKFLQEQCQVSYSTFCKYRPFWVVFPHNERDTCMCKLHCNVDLLLKALKREKITAEASGSEIIRSLCCDYSKDKCLQRTCKVCKNRVVNFFEFSNDKKVAYYQWINKKKIYTDKSGTEKIKTVWTKEKIEDYPRNLIMKLDAIQNTYFIHCRAITIQYFEIKYLKQNLMNKEILIHVDFSENYCLKYHEEIQSFHFGGSRGQVSLHTGVLYYKDETKGTTSKSFCTMSKNLNHDAGSVWAHLSPILKMAQNLVPGLKVIHFLSDSPSSQYRNRFIFYMITKLKEHVKDLEKVTWNYHEAGHGKGAPDGVGAVMKRTADNYVKFGGDIGSFEAFTEVIRQEVQTIHIEVVNEEEVAKDRFPRNIPGFRGTNKVHQVVWCLSLPNNIALRSLSCFKCEDNYIPCSHGKHLGNLCFDALLSNETVTQSVTENYCDRPRPDDILNVDNFHIDSPTLANNIQDLSSIENEIIFDDILMPVDVSKSPKVKILSDIRVNWQNHSFYKTPSRSFNPFDQQDFEDFIQASPIIINDNSNKENNFVAASHQPHEFAQKVEDPHSNKNINAMMVDKSHENMFKQVDYPDYGMTVDQTRDELVNKIDSAYNWVIVQYQIKSKLYSYIGQVKERTIDQYKISFLKKVGGKSLKFFWPINIDEDTVPESRLIKIEEPICTRRGQYIFENLPQYNYK